MSPVPAAGIENSGDANHSSTLFRHHTFDFGQASLI
jgi:hypothetical protein